MKKLLCILLFFMLTLSALASCAQTGSTDTTDNTAGTDTTADVTRDTTVDTTKENVVTDITGEDTTSDTAEDTTVVGDPPAMPQIEPMTKEQMTEIETAWLEKNGYTAKLYDEDDIVTRHFGLRYYGTYNGYVILFHPLNRVSDCVIVIQAETKIQFKYPVQFNLYAYRDGEFYSLETVLAEGYLSENEIQVAADCHQAMEYEIQSREDLDDPYQYTDVTIVPLETLSATLREEIDASESGGILKSTYCGMYNGYYVFGGDNTGLRAFSPFVIGGKVFDLSQNYFGAYKDGKIHQLIDVFNAGDFTPEDMANIAYRYYGERYPWSIK